MSADQINDSASEDLEQLSELKSKTMIPSLEQNKKGRLPHS